MSNNKQSMGDMQFNGTPEEWEALVMKNKMTNNKKSSVEWLEDKLNNIKPNEFCSIETIKEWVKQAKAMHKEEVEDAYWEGGQDVPVNGKQCERYYNETYGGNK